MKKSVLLFLSAGLLFSNCSCGNNNTKLKYDVMYINQNCLEVGDIEHLSKEGEDFNNKRCYIYSHYVFTSNNEGYFEEHYELLDGLSSFVYIHEEKYEFHYQFIEQSTICLTWSNEDKTMFYSDILVVGPNMLIADTLYSTYDYYNKCGDADNMSKYYKDKN